MLIVNIIASSDAEPKIIRAEIPDWIFVFFSPVAFIYEFVSWRPVRVNGPFGWIAW